MNNVLKLIRYKNLLIIILTQSLVYFCLSNTGISGFDWKILPLIAGTVLIAAAGNLINDFFDKAADQINRPGTNAAELLEENKKLIYSYFILNVLGLLAGFMISYAIGNIFLFTIVILYLYTIFLKKRPLAGNLTVALLLSITLIVVHLFSPVSEPLFLIFYCLFAFISGFIRELIKDVEDIEGDSQTESQTFPVIYGTAKTLLIVKILSVVMLISIILFQVILAKNNYWITFVYFIAAVFVPTSFIFNLTIKATDKKDFSHLSNNIKLLMLAGILSMLLIKFQL